MQFLIGFLLALLIAATARILRSLSLSGAAAATALGTIVYGFGGWQSAALLITFFVTSSLAGTVSKHRVHGAETSYAKGTERDAGQVLANGAVSGFLAMAAATPFGVTWSLLALAGSVAAVTADTWATELGALSASPPRLITRLGRSVPPGTSGGISPVGTLAAGMGAALIAVFAALTLPGARSSWIPVIAGAGLMAALFDSWLGATVQAMYRCVRENTETEQHPLHRCGSPTILIRGWPWLNNDIVNFACAALGAAIAGGTGALLGLL